MSPEVLPQVTDRSPRHYAQAYLKAKGMDAQRAALKGCPQQWQDLVRLHIRIARKSCPFIAATKT